MSPRYISAGCGVVWCVCGGGLTLCSSRTGALVRVDQVDAGTSVLTGLGLTLVDLLGAVYAVVSRDTLIKK